MKNTKSFYFHYNKPESKKKNKPQITVHYNKTCYIVDNLVVNCKTYGRIRKVQPFFVIAGKTKGLRIENKIGILD